jgi:hypothetical protein
MAPAFCVICSVSCLVRPPKGSPAPDWERLIGWAGAKKSAMPRRCSSVVALSSHMRRKKAIIAVTKSAYATFQAPP